MLGLSHTDSIIDAGEERVMNSTTLLLPVSDRYSYQHKPSVEDFEEELFE